MPRVTGLRCRACAAPVPTGPSYVCPRCFGPLEVVYDEAAIAETLSREAIEARGSGIWRYLELLPVETPPARSLPGGSTPLQDGAGPAGRLGVGRLWLKNDSLNPTLSFKDRVVAVGAARAVEFGFHTLACASTGNLPAPLPPPPARPPPPAPAISCAPWPPAGPPSCRSRSGWRARAAARSRRSPTRRP